MIGRCVVRDVRTFDRILFHYNVERKLADRLRHASSSERGSLYSSVYNELFESIPDHEQHQRKDDAETSKQETERQFRILRRFVGDGDVYLEVGAGDGALSARVAERVGTCYAVEVSSVIMQNTRLPENVMLILSDGTSIPVPEESVDVAYSNQLMEHLHPEDAKKQLVNIYRALAPGARYICITPNRLSGPHDISRYFDVVSTCLHLREYTNYELRVMFSEVGFRGFRAILSWRLLVVPWLLPLGPFIIMERCLERLPIFLRRKLSLALAAVKLVAVK
jgi:SAM-dependent methyltransferase